MEFFALTMNDCRFITILMLVFMTNSFFSLACYDYRLL